MSRDNSFALFAAFRHPLASLVVVLFALFVAAVVFLYTFPSSMDRTVTLRIRGVSVSAKLAETAFERERGLSGRPSIGEFEGMLFLEREPGKHAIWMKDMRFPIDIIWIKNGRVVDIEERVEPEPGVADDELKIYTPDVSAELVLELPAGFSARYGITIDDDVILSAGELPPRYRGFLPTETR